MSMLPGYVPYAAILRRAPKAERAEVSRGGNRFFPPTILTQKIHNVFKVFGYGFWGWGCCFSSLYFCSSL